ncbi:Panacea domain-containing protein [Henriciella sp.]|uniref:Panacea domain-containing protein n=1 Tax=Henriciella sp. TaxID=1968823 RepID=UPI000C10EC5E|nr:Panacea domain-containing protein [Henriciella sp.]PHR77847.1 MAG: hypothetical protein COA64_08690 [Henriciella sp.]
MGQHIQFDREKFKDAIWTVASLCPPEELGNVKLHKILYFADMLTFLDEGRPLTGVEYLKQKFGPTARYLTAAVAELAAEGLLSVEETDYHGFLKKTYVPHGAPRITRLSEAEITLLREVSEYVRGKSAKEISEISHNAAWEAAELGEVIPYTTALKLAPVEIKDSDRQWAKETALAYANQDWPS